MLKPLTITLFLFISLYVKASISIIDAQGWLETAWVKWQLPQGNSELRYNIYVSEADKDSWTKLDDELVRNYGTYGRADALGLKAGSYQLKVVQVINGVESAEETVVSSSLEVRAHDRTGFAHMNRDTEDIFEGVGAYRNDGTLKDNAIVIYVTANNAKTITQDLQYYESDKKNIYKSYTGIGRILEGYRKCWARGKSKGFTLPALDVRIIGLLTRDDMDYLNGAGLQIKGENDAKELPITIEGVGSDATIHGFGFSVSQVSGVEIRNLGIMLYNDDGISVTSYGKHLWLHNNDIFYGSTGKDEDQVKGDGAIDIKLSQYCTVSYNHFFDCGKCSLLDAGEKTEDWDDQITYHHNWFDHSDERNPRCRNGRMFHVYNNYFDGNGLYGIGMACGSSTFAECNYFRNCQFPVINSAQGTDKQMLVEKQIANVEISNKGYLSGEKGGVTKWWNNIVKNARSLYTQNTAVKSYSFDVYEVESRDEVVPSSIKTLKGGTSYSNFDTSASFYSCTPDAPEDVPAVVMSKYGAGRCEQGDFKWQFDNSVQDENEKLIVDLKNDLAAYLSTLVGYFGTDIKNGGGTGNSGGDVEKNEDYVPSYLSGSTVIPSVAYGIGISTDKWHSIDGTTLRNAPVSRGVYIRNGKKVVK